MSTRHVKRRDANHGEIVSALERCGWSVLDLSQVGGGAPDVLAGRSGVTMLCEIKSGRGQLRVNQVEWAAQWRGSPPVVLRSVEDVVTLSQRLALHAGIHRVMGAKKI